MKKFNYIKLRVIMAENDIKNICLAKAIDVSEVTISNWRKGNNPPRLRNRIKLAIFFNVPQSYFIT